MVVRFDAHDQSYSEAINRVLSFSGTTVDFFTRVKTDYFVRRHGVTPPWLRIGAADQHRH